MSKRSACLAWVFSMRNWVALFILGSINNLSYVVVGSAAQDIVTFYNVENLIGLIPWYVHSR